MKIAINAAILGTQPTGTNVYTEQVLRALALLPELAPHSIEIWTPRLLNLPAHMIQHALPDNLGRSTRGHGNALRRFFWNQRVFARLSKDCDRRYCPTYNTAICLSGQIVTIHDLIALRFPRQHLLQYAYCHFILPILLRRSRGIIAISEATRQEICSHFSISPEHVVVIPNGLDHQAFQATSGKGDQAILRHHEIDQYALVVGATFPHKNVEVLLQAFQQASLGTQLQLVIVGAPNDYLRAIRKKAREMGLQACVRFLGYVESAEMSALYRQAQMLLYPSLWEGFGLPLLEAMACGCPVIASNTSSLPEVGGNAACYCDPNNAKAWSAAIHHLLTNGDLRQDLVQKGLERVPSYSWENTARGIARVLLTES